MSRLWCNFLCQIGLKLCYFGRFYSKKVSIARFRAFGKGSGADLAERTHFHHVLAISALETLTMGGNTLK